MSNARKLAAISSIVTVLAVQAQAQIPDLLTSFDAGGRAMGLGGGIGATSADTFSGLNNPAGLAYVSVPTIGLAIRNMPQSKTTLNSSFTSPVLDSRGEVGHIGLSHAGVVIPVKKKGGRSAGAVGLSYTVGGYIRDARTGNGALPINATTGVVNYQELIKAKTDFFTVAYGWSNGDQSLAIGAGLVVATQFILNRQSYDVQTASGNVPNPPVDLSGQGTGIGAVLGIQYIPKDNQNVNLGLSIRTPINLSGNTNTAVYYDRIPGKISAGAAVRKDNFRGDDYLVYGVQMDAFFRNYRSASLQRKRTVNLGAGLEYNMVRGFGRIPVRLGFSVIPAAGTGFKDRNALTFGVGYRPFSSNLSVDLNFASTGSGGLDSSLLLNYRLKN